MPAQSLIDRVSIHNAHTKLKFNIFISFSIIMNQSSIWLVFRFTNRQSSIVALVTLIPILKFNLWYIVSIQFISIKFSFLFSVEMNIFYILFTIFFCMDFNKQIMRIEFKQIEIRKEPNTLILYNYIFVKYKLDGLNRYFTLRQFSRMTFKRIVRNVIEMIFFNCTKKNMLERLLRKDIGLASCKNDIHRKIISNLI